METSRRQTEAAQGNDDDERKNKWNESNKSGEKRKFPLQLQQRLLQRKEKENGRVRVKSEIKGKGRKL